MYFLITNDVETTSLELNGLTSFIAEKRKNSLRTALLIFFTLWRVSFTDRKRTNRMCSRHNSVMPYDKKLKNPECTAIWYGLRYFLPGRKPLSEKGLVNKILILYSMCGVDGDVR